MRVEITVRRPKLSSDADAKNYAWSNKKEFVPANYCGHCAIFSKERERYMRKRAPVTGIIDMNQIRPPHKSLWRKWNDHVCNFVKHLKFTRFPPVQSFQEVSEVVKIARKTAVEWLLKLWQVARSLSPCEASCFFFRGFFLVFFLFGESTNEDDDSDAMPRGDSAAQKRLLRELLVFFSCYQTALDVGAGYNRAKSRSFSEMFLQ